MLLIKDNLSLWRLQITQSEYYRVEVRAPQVESVLGSADSENSVLSLPFKFIQKKLLARHFSVTGFGTISLVWLLLGTFGLTFYVVFVSGGNFSLETVGEHLVTLKRTVKRPIK